MNFRTILISFSIIAISGCVPFKPLYTENLKQITKDNIRQLEGIYPNTSDDGFAKFQNSLWGNISSNNGRSYDEEWKNYSIKIQVVNNRLLRAQLLDKGEIIKKKSVHGKIKGGYFYKRREFFIIPFVPLIFGYVNNQIRFGVTDKELIVDEAGIRFGFFIMAGGSNKRISTTKFTRK